MKDYILFVFECPHVVYDIFKVHNKQEHVIRIFQFCNPGDPTAILGLKKNGWHFYLVPLDRPNPLELLHDRTHVRALDHGDNGRAGLT